MFYSPFIYIWRRVVIYVKHLYAVYFAVLPLVSLPIVSLDDIYILRAKTRFLSSFSDLNTMYNSNINPAFYNRLLIQECIKQCGNEIEREWRSRIMFESTPRGNVVIFYDVFKEGFSYYSDQSGIPYSVLNAAIMKYVLMYRCRDFFIDDYIVPDANISPFVVMSRNEKALELSLKRDVIKKMATFSATGDLPFAKLKVYSSATIRSAGTSMIQSSPIIVDKVISKDYIKNKFIYLGKIKDFSFLSSIPKKNGNLCTSFDSVLDVKSSGSIANRLDYKSFKASGYRVPL
jgi:hypothetical protein